MNSEDAKIVVVAQEVARRTKRIADLRLKQSDRAKRRAIRAYQLASLATEAVDRLVQLINQKDKK